jgi:hypothetical protein
MMHNYLQHPIICPSPEMLPRKSQKPASVQKIQELQSVAKTCKLRYESFLSKEKQFLNNGSNDSNSKIHRKKLLENETQ